MPTATNLLTRNFQIVPQQRLSLQGLFARRTDDLAEQRSAGPEDAAPPRRSERTDVRDVQANDVDDDEEDDEDRARVSSDFSAVLNAAIKTQLDTPKSAVQKTGQSDGESSGAGNGKVAAAVIAGPESGQGGLSSGASESRKNTGVESATLTGAGLPLTTGLRSPEAQKALADSAKEAADNSAGTANITVGSETAVSVTPAVASELSAGTDSAESIDQFQPSLTLQELTRLQTRTQRSQQQTAEPNQAKDVATVLPDGSETPTVDASVSSAPSVTATTILPAVSETDDTAEIKPDRTNQRAVGSVSGQSQTTAEKVTAAQAGDENSADADLRKALASAEIVPDAQGSAVIDEFPVLPDFGVNVPAAAADPVPPAGSQPVDVIPAETPVSLAGAIPSLPETTTPKDTPPPANTAVASAGVESVSGSSMTGLSGVVSGGAGLAETVSAEIRQPLTAQISRAVYEYVQRQGAGGNENTSMTLRLDPPTLGELVISLSQTAEGIAVRVTAREPVTMDMLLARGQEIESQLKSQDLNLAGVEFLNADQFSGSSHQQNSSGRDRFASAEEAAAGVRNRAGRVTSGKSSGRGEQTGEPPASGSRLSFRA
jgi:hypothetical protein